MGTEVCAAFAPGRVNLIGEHTDYNGGLALPFAIAAGVTVRAQVIDRPLPGCVRAYASDLAEHDEFPLVHPPRGAGWRMFVRGTVAELARAGVPLRSASLQISGDVPRGCGLSSSAALEVALCMALIEIGRRNGDGVSAPTRLEIASLCRRVENDWVGAQTGLLDPLACLYGASEAALRIDFRSLTMQQLPLRLNGWHLAVLDSGEHHAHASSGYNERRQECAEACGLLGVPCLREADHEQAARLPEPLRRRVRHVLEENERVMQATVALASDDLPRLGTLLSASHASLRDCYEVSSAAVEDAIARLLRAGAAGARVVGGGFGGSVLGLFPPGANPPAGAQVVHPAMGARMLPLSAQAD